MKTYDLLEPTEFLPVSGPLPDVISLDLQKPADVGHESSLIIYPEFEGSIELELGKNVLALTRQEQLGTSSKFIRARQAYTLTNLTHFEQPTLVIPAADDRSNFTLRIGSGISTGLMLDGTADDKHLVLAPMLTGLALTDLQTKNSTIVRGRHQDLGKTWQHQDSSLEELLATARVTSHK